MPIFKNVYIVAAKRTAFGKFGGKLKDMNATGLQEVAAKAAIEQSKIPADMFDSVIIGNIMHSSPDAGYLSRHVGLRCGLPIHAPALTINRLCGSGFQSIILGAQEIHLGDSKVVLCGGTESMSLAPYSIFGNRFGTRFGADLNAVDTLWAGLTDSHVKLPMALTAENLAEQYKLTREQCDAYALRSQLRWKNAQTNGYFKNEIAPIKLKGRKGEESFEVDEHPRPQTTMDELAKLAPVFKKGGTVTAGNASGICDGASAVVLADEETVNKHGLTPLARLVSYHVSGCDPKVMGIGPVPAIRHLLKKTSLDLSKIDLVEVNEAFAPQYLAVEKELGLNPDISNSNGGAIALGHPLAASGNRITGHLVYELARRKGKYAIGSACIGGGQGIAVLLESI